MAMSFVIINSTSKKFEKKVTFKIYSAVCTGRNRKYMKLFSFPWPPVLAAHGLRVLHEHCTAVEIIGSINLIARIIRVHQILQYCSKCP